MLIVGINGSPKKEGNTKYLINTVLEEAKSQGVETMVLEVGETFKFCKEPILCCLQQSLLRYML